MTQLETTLQSLASRSVDEHYRGLIYAGGCLYATDKKNIVSTKFDYKDELEGKIVFADSTKQDVDKISLYKIKEVISRYKKERGVDNINIEDLSVIISFSDVYNTYASHKIEYIRINNALYGISSLKDIIKLANHLNVYLVATSKIKIARALILHDSDSVLLISECQPEESDYSYIEYRDASIVFGEMNTQKLKSVITKKIDKAKRENKQTKVRELTQELNILCEFSNIKH